MNALKNKVTATLGTIGSLMSALHYDERGDNENLGRMLILALILIPLVILLATFGQEIYDSAEEAWGEVIDAEVE